MLPCRMRATAPPLNGDFAGLPGSTRSLRSGTLRPRCPAGQQARTAWLRASLAERQATGPLPPGGASSQPAPLKPTARTGMCVVMAAVRCSGGRLRLVEAPPRCSVLEVWTPPLTSSDRPILLPCGIGTSAITGITARAPQGFERLAGGGHRTGRAVAATSIGIGRWN
jgi:hypothetical protein